MDKLKLSTANLVILIAGAVMLIASFLAFNKFSRASVTVGIRPDRRLVDVQRLEQRTSS